MSDQDQYEEFIFDPKSAKSLGEQIKDWADANVAITKIDISSGSTPQEKKEKRHENP